MAALINKTDIKARTPIDCSITTNTGQTADIESEKGSRHFSQFDFHCSRYSIVLPIIRYDKIQFAPDLIWKALYSDKTKAGGVDIRSVVR